MMQIQHPVVDWYLAFDDLWELMRVNYGTHNPFTQNGMWDVGDSHVNGVVMVIDMPPYRGVMLSVDQGTGEEATTDHMVIATYGPRCNECGYQPYNAAWFGDSDFGDFPPIGWGTSTIDDLIFNAIQTGVDKYHEDTCSRLRYPDPEPSEGDDGETSTDT